MHRATMDSYEDEAVRVEQGFTVVPVPEGRDGSVWMLRVRKRCPDLRFLNIPGLLAYCPSELVLPKRFAAETPAR